MKKRIRCFRPLSLLLALLLLLAVLLFSAVGCTVSSAPPNGSTSQGSSALWEGYRPPVTETFVTKEASCIYMSFDDICKTATDVVIASFSGLRTEVGTCGEFRELRYLYDFNVVKTVRGLGTESLLTVNSSPADCHVVGTDLAYSTYNCLYEEGKTYLLLLSRNRSVYNERDTFAFTNESLLIPLQETTSNTVSTAELQLYGEPLSSHILSTDLLKDFGSTSYLKSIAELTKENPFYRGPDYDTSTDMASVIQNADFVLEVSVDALFMESFDGSRTTYTCSLVQNLKGTAASDTFTVVFPGNSDRIGKTYIVAVNELDSPTFFVMSSKNSVFDCSDRSTVQSLIEESRS